MIPVRVERVPIPDRTSTRAEPSDLAPPPTGAPQPPLFSLNPQKPVHLFVVMPLVAALALLPLGGVGGLVWWKWLRPTGVELESDDNGEHPARGARVRYLLFALLLWFALSLLLILDLLGAVSLYLQFVAIYAAFWILIGALLLYDRPLLEKLLVLAVFVSLLFALRFVDWNSRKPFLRDLYRVEEGMTFEQVAQQMADYERSVGQGAQVDDRGRLVSGTLSYTHTDQDWGNSDIGQVTFQDGQVTAVKFLPD